MEPFTSYDMTSGNDQMTSENNDVSTDTLYEQDEEVIYGAIDSLYPCESNMYDTDNALYTDTTNGISISYENDSNKSTEVIYFLFLM